jgi:Tol biopolymer transport system component
MRRPRAGFSAFLLLAALSVAAFGQMTYYPYYGKNKINYERFPWKTYATEHFTVYFYADDMRLLQYVVDTAESAYKKVSFDLKHQLAEPVPLIFYTTFTDFEQSNIFPVSEGVLGVSEPILFRIGIHGDMPVNEFQDTMTHELAHIFQFDLLWGNQGGALTAVTQPPGWTFEGLSEYVTGRWSSWSTLILRDTVLNDRIPEFDESGDLVLRYPLPRDPAYDFGHAIYEFIVDRYGPNAIRDFWQVLKSSNAFLARRNPFLRAFQRTPRDFGQEFKKYLRARFKDFYARENPEDYSVPLGPEFPINPYYFAFSHALSPTGELVATITYNARDNDMNIVLISSKDGRILKTITKRYASDYEYIKYEIDPSLGPSLAWSPDGDRIVFFARDGRRHSLFIISPLTGETLKKIVLPLDQPTGPCFLPDGRTLLFTAFEKGIHDIFAIDLESGVTRNLTNDEMFEKAPAVSPDGKTLVYSVRAGEEDKLVLSPLSDLKTRTVLSPGPGNAICPSFSSDGKTIFYAGDGRGAYNIYSLSLETGDVRRHTDVRTGNFFPAALPGGPNMILFSSFNKGSFQLFKGQAAGPVETTIAIPAAEHDKPFEKFKPTLTFDLHKDKIEEHTGLGKLYVTARPPVDAIISTDGSIYGGSAISFSDVLANHQFSIMAYQVREFRSYGFTYANLSGRLQYAVNAFQYAIYYYPDLYYYDPTLWSRATYNDATAVRKITGVTLSLFYPLDRYMRLEGGLGFYNYEEDFLDPYSMSTLGYQGGYGFINGTMLTASVSLTGETTRFKEYGPATGSTFRLSVSQSLPVAQAFLHNTMLDADVRKYFYLGADFLVALRFQGALCAGRDKFLSYYGGNNQVRSAYFYSIVATEYWFANAEFRFPLINLAQTIIGTIGPVRGVLFFDITRSKYGDYPAKFYFYDPTRSTADSMGYVTGDAFGSLGAGLEMFLFGLPIHFEWVKRMEWTSIAKPFSFNSVGSYELRFWIGYDF